jgi:hypothetical protein
MSRIIRLYDGFNYYRMAAERDMTQLAPRRLYEEMACSSDLHIWVWDAPGCNETRRALYPAYKTKRKPAREDIRASLDLWRKILMYANAHQIEIPGFEADDVLAGLVEHYAGSGAQIAIYSNDRDLLQLAHGRPNVHLGVEPKPDAPPADIRLYKTFVGDASDNIAGAPGFGQTAWARADRAQLRKVIEAAESRSSDDYDDAVSRACRNIASAQRKRIESWLVANPRTLMAMWTITGFFPPAQAVLTQHCRAGLNNREAAEKLFAQYLM